MNHPETQAFLAELKNPTHHPPALLKAWMKGSASVLTKEGQQIALIRGLLQEAEGVEDSPLLPGKMSTIVQQVDAQQRILGNIAREGRKLRQSRSDLGVLIQEFRALAADAGYTVP